MDYVIGGQILESLTTGMYKDSRMIFREYIQNACDAIDAAVKAGILAEGEGEIRIEIDPESRRIVIEDNGTGIRAKDFARVLGNIADSDKRIGEERGFRGIGRLCGMAYCGTVVFRSKFKGECVVSEMRCDAETLRSLFPDRNSGIKMNSASAVLALVNQFTTEPTEDVDVHFFRVEIEDIEKVNTELLDYKGVKEYLSFTAPVPYQISFAPMYSEIYRHAGELGLKIEEYNIFLNDEQLFKAYTTRYGTRLGEEEIFSLEFKDFTDKEGKLIAWLWYGVSCFKAQIERGTIMQGIRLRKGNIQVGDEYTMSRFFEETRGNLYFIGELFCVSKELVPNSQRDYFSENPARAYFEAQVRALCAELKVIYTAGSALNSSYKKLKQAELRGKELELRIEKDQFIDDESRQKADEELRACIEEAASRKKAFDRAAAKTEITYRIAKQIEQKPVHPQQAGNVAQKRSSYTQREKQLLNRVFGILKDELGRTADSIIEKIEQGLGLS